MMLFIFVLFVRLFFVLRPSNYRKSYQDGYRVVTVRTHDDFIVLSQNEADALLIRLVNYYLCVI